MARSFTDLGFSYPQRGELADAWQWSTTSNCGYHAAVTYFVYDALGRRVEQPGVQIVYGIDGGKLALMNHQTVSKAFAPLPAGSAAVYTGTTLAWYRHPDWLGSSSVTSLPSGTDRRSRDVSYSPFGDIAAENGPGTADHNFTGQNQDLTSIPYDFPAREYSQGEGRWISPDPAGVAAVDPANPQSPQSWNRYSYVNNNPLSLIDPTGMDTLQQDTFVRVVEVNGCLYLQNGTSTWWVDPVADRKNKTVTWGGMSLLTCIPSGTGPHGPGGGGGEGTGDPSSGQKFAKCMEDRHAFFSVPGTIDQLSALALGKDPDLRDSALANLIAGNAALETYYALFGTTRESAADVGPASAHVGHYVAAFAAGTPATYARRTSTFISMNIPPAGGTAPGGLPVSLSNGAWGKFLKDALKGLKVTAAVDAGYALADALTCLLRPE